MSDYITPELWTSILNTIAPFVEDASERRKVVRTFLPDMLDSGFSGSQALNIFRDSGLGISTKSFYDIRREINADTSLFSILRTASLDDVISENFMRQSSYDLGSKYRYVASFVLENTETGDAIFGEYAINSNDIMQKKDILSSIVSIIQSKYPQNPYDELTVNLRRAYINTFS